MCECALFCLGDVGAESVFRCWSNFSRTFLPLWKSYFNCSIFGFAPPYTLHPKIWKRTNGSHIGTINAHSSIIFRWNSTSGASCWRVYYYYLSIQSAKSSFCQTVFHSNVSPSPPPSPAHRLCYRRWIINYNIYWCVDDNNNMARLNRPL